MCRLSLDGYNTLYIMVQIIIQVPLKILPSLETVFMWSSRGTIAHPPSMTNYVDCDAGPSQGKKDLFRGHCRNMYPPWNPFLAVCRFGGVSYRWGSELSFLTHDLCSARRKKLHTCCKEPRFHSLAGSPCTGSTGLFYLGGPWHEVIKHPPIPFQA